MLSDLLNLARMVRTRPRNMTFTMTNIPVEKIRLDGGTEQRVEIDNALVLEYAALMRDGVKFPLVVVFFDGKD
jgi:hypothetical protein